MCQTAGRNGRRTTASGVNLSNLPSNLTINTNVTAEKVLFDQGKAVGSMTSKGENGEICSSYNESSCRC